MAATQDHAASVVATQAQMISAGGFAVKNTFIDGPPASVVAGPLPARRASSAPPSGTGRSSLSASAKAVEVEFAQSDMSNDTDSPSTLCPESDSFSESGDGISTSSEHGDLGRRESGCPSPLQLLIERECRFLLLQECVLHPIRSQTRQKAFPEGVNACLRIFIRGLPTAKRSKWQHQLSWSVLSILQRAGCSASIRRGQIYASLDGVSGSEVVRVDFSPSRI